MGAGFCSLYHEISYIEVRYIKTWVYYYCHCTDGKDCKSWFNNASSNFFERRPKSYYLKVFKAMHQNAITTGYNQFFYFFAVNKGKNIHWNMFILKLEKQYLFYTMSFWCCLSILFCNQFQLLWDWALSMSRICIKKG